MSYSKLKERLKHSLLVTIFAITAALMFTIAIIYFFTSNITKADTVIKDGALIRSIGGMDVYIVKLINGKRYKRLILNPKVLNSYKHLHWSDVVQVDQIVLDSYATSNVVKIVNDTRVWQLNPTGDHMTGSKAWIQTADAFLAMGYSWDQIYTINSTEASLYNTSTDITSAPNTSTGNSQSSPVVPPVIQSTPHSQNTTTPGVSSIVPFKFALQSKFFRNDPTAQALASGNLPSVDSRSFALFVVDPADTNVFAYRFLSGLRMVGYTQGRHTAGDQYLAEIFLNKFQRHNGLPESNQITSAELIRLDALVAQQETIDTQLAYRNPLFIHFKEAPLNEPPKEHAAAAWTIALDALPNSLVSWTEANFKDYMKLQLGGFLNDLGGGNYEVCDGQIYHELGDECRSIILPNGTSLNNKVFGIVDDYDNVVTKIHEYAHFLDRNVYKRNVSTSQGLIDTMGFYAISYDITNPIVGAGGINFFTLKRPTNSANELVSGYAKGWQLSVGSPYLNATEDFAESFTMYVNQGKIFRSLAESNPVLKQKYDWLKLNVFNGFEYQTGTPDGLSYLKASPVGTGIATGAFNTADYSEAVPDFVWSYKFK